MHIQFQKLLLGQKIDLDNELPEELLSYMQAEKCELHLFSGWLHDIKRDVLAFAQFLIDYEVKPLAIEIVIASREYGYAGAIDLVCEMWVDVKGFFGETYKSGDKKGQPKESTMKKRMVCIVDFKSGRKGFYEAHEIQLHAYKKAFNENFPKIQIDKLFNFAPAEWVNAPSYKLKDQTDSVNAAKLPFMVEIAKIDKAKRKMTFTLVEGIVDPKCEDGVSKNYQEIPLDQYIKLKNAANERED